MSENVARVTSKADVSHDDKLTNELNHLSYGVHALSSSNNFCWRKLRSYRTAVFWCLLSTAGASSIEYHNTTANAVISNVGFIARVGEPDLGAGHTRAFDPRHVEVWTGVYSAGFLLVSSVSWLLLDRFGRKAGLLSAQVLLATSIISQMVTRNWSAWMIARLLAGLAAGLNQCATISYISEAAPMRMRGASLAAYQVALIFGQFCACCAEQLLAITATLEYKRLLLSQIPFLALGLLASLSVPESPRWLVIRGYQDRAVRSLARLYGGIDGDDIDDSLQTICQEIDDCHVSGSWRRLLRSSNLASIKRRLLLSSFPLAWQTWFGLPIILRYTLYFFQLSGVIDPFITGLSTRAILALGSLMVVGLVDVLGRRTILLSVAPAMPLALFAIGGLVHQPLQAWTGGVLTFFACAWMFAFSASLAPMAWVYLGETSNTRLRAKTISIATSLATAFDLLGRYCSPVMIANHSFGLFTTACLYGCTGVVGIVVLFFFAPETKNLSFGQMDSLYGRGIPARAFLAALGKRADTRVRPFVAPV